MIYSSVRPRRPAHHTFDFDTTSHSSTLAIIPAIFVMPYASNTIMTHRLNSILITSALSPTPIAPDGVADGWGVAVAELVVDVVLLPLLLDVLVVLVLVPLKLEIDETGVVDVGVGPEVLGEIGVNEGVVRPCPAQFCRKLFSAVWAV